jgi:hypothetical protein
MCTEKSAAYLNVMSLLLPAVTEYNHKNLKTVCVQASFEFGTSQIDVQKLDHLIQIPQ